MTKLRKRNAVAALVLLGVLVGHATAQSVAHDGRWRADFTGETGKSRTGTVVIQGKIGTWDMDTQSKTNPCIGMAVPAAVQQGAQEVTLRIERSKVMATCPDTTMRLRVEPNGTLVGSFRGAPFVLSRIEAASLETAARTATSRRASASPMAVDLEASRSGSARKIQMLYFGGNDCPPCVVWRGLELPKLQQMAVFQTVEYVHVTKSIGSVIPSNAFLPDVVKPYKAQLDAAGSGNRGSSQTAIIVDGQVFDFYFGPRSADEISARLLAIRAGGAYPFERCIELRPGNAAQCIRSIPAS